MTVTGYTRRAIGMYVGFGVYNIAADDGYVLNWNDDQFPSRAIILSSMRSLSAYGGAGNGIAIFDGDSGYEDTTRPGKIEVTGTVVRGWNFRGSLADTFTMTTIPPVVYADYVPIYTGRFNQDPGEAPGSPIAGTRYDVHWSRLCYCRENVLHIHNLPPLSSVRLTVGAFAPVVHDTDLAHSVAHNFLGAMFPARVTVEIFSGKAAAGTLLAKQVLPRCYGGDEYTSRPLSTVTAIIPGPPLSRVGWIASAPRAWSAPADALDGSMSTRYATGGALNVGYDYFSVDMLAPQMVGTVRYENVSYLAFNADIGASGTIQTSTDGAVWTTRATYGAGDVYGAGGIQCSFAPVLARYVKLTPSAPSADYTRWFAVHEMNAFATTPE